jgi:uncharacterized protein
LTTAEIDDVVDILSIQTEAIESPDGHEAKLRDTNNQPVLCPLLAALQLDGGNYLITSGKDLLALAGRYPIVTLA